MIPHEQIEKPKKIKDVDSLEAEEAAKIEYENYLKVRDATMQLNKALETQEQTLNELKKQGETISQVKNTAIKVLENSKASCETEFQIKEESKIFPSFDNVLNRIKRWWNKDRKMENEVLEIKGRIKTSDMCKDESVSSNEMETTGFVDEKIDYQSEETFKNSDFSNRSAMSIDNKRESSPIISPDAKNLNEELIPGETQTDSELSNILEVLKKINTGAKTQIEVIKEQKKDIKDISKLGDFSSKIVDETEKQMKKK